ncbi:MAG: hypothetical protein MUC50_18160 [Myxococcota bacterium]|jgi:hypothetical protein|nr:hypothetical protein [Myxococcota bacterium]
MWKFLLGFGVASVIWGGVLLAQATGLVDLGGASQDGELLSTDTAQDALAATGEQGKGSKKAGKRKRQKRAGWRPETGVKYDTGEGRIGDDLGAPGARELSMGAGGEDQLSSAEIEAGVDRVFNGIERCLILVPNAAPAVGKVVVGMKIAPSGAVSSVDLAGPNVIIKGESGSCIRRAVKSIRFRSFNGPEMIVHYPIVFE